MHVRWEKEVSHSITSQNIAKLRDLIYKESGMLFDESKDYLIKSRVTQRMNECDAGSFSEYFGLLVSVTQKQELQKFLEKITINETYFFRDFPQLQGFAEKVLPSYVDKKNSKNLNVWSAACSTGEEPYTLSIILTELIEESGWSINIDASDIDRNVLDKAKKAVYSNRSLKDTPIVYRKKYFEEMDSSWMVNTDKLIPINFRQLNFIDRKEMRNMKGYDFIFCRNVLIYFDEVSRKKVVNMLYDALIPGGYLFLGHSESIGRISSAFKLENIGGFLCYKKPE